MCKVFSSIMLSLLAVLSSLGATYNGKNIDGKKYAASVNTGKIILSVDVVFDGKAGLIYSDSIITGKLYNEIIDDPHDIEIAVGSEAWTIDIMDSLR